MKIKNQLFCLILITLFSNHFFAQDTISKKILWTIDWSSDGKFIAIGGNTDTLKIYRETNLKLHKSLPIKSTIARVKWHPSKNSIAVAT